MKAFAFIFIVYIVVLTVQPCDELAMPALGVNLIAEAETAQVAHQSPDRESGETCSPFCFCSCCSVTAVFHYAVYGPSETPPPILAETRSAEYASLNVRTYTTSIWQPPKA